MLWILAGFVASWGPMFHQVIARQFSYEYFPNISDLERDSFILGSIYADGLDKGISHHVPQVIKKLKKNNNTESDIYWFFLGMFSHIPPDTFAHAGKSRSFITAGGLKHHISELVVDSLVTHLHHPSYMRITSSLRHQLSDMKISFIKSFRYMYSLVYTVAKLPLYRLLPKIERDNCPKVSLSMSLCTFLKHYEVMLESLREALPRLQEAGFNDQRVREISTRLVWNVGCCDPATLNAADQSREEWSAL